MPNSIQRIDVAGRDVTEYMQLLFRKSGYVFHTSAEKEIVRTIKEKLSYVAVDPKKEEKEWMQHAGRADSKVVEYTLPDGNKMKVGRSHAFSRSTTLKVNRLERRDTARLRSFSTLRSLDSNIQEYMKSLSMPSTGLIWISENIFSALSCCRGVEHLPRGSETGCYMKCRDWRSKI